MISLHIIFFNVCMVGRQGVRLMISLHIMFFNVCMVGRPGVLQHNGMVISCETEIYV